MRITFMAALPYLKRARQKSKHPTNTHNTFGDHNTSDAVLSVSNSSANTVKRKYPAPNSKLAINPPELSCRRAFKPNGTATNANARHAIENEYRFVISVWNPTRLSDSNS
jgi:hypothetical protein